MADITIRLHRQHDMDLINLYRIPGYKFQRVMKEVLIAAANGIPYQVQLPGKDEKPEEGYVPGCMTMHISLNMKQEKERKAYELLKSVKYGFRNSFLKALFRSYSPKLPLSSFFEGDGLKMHYTGIKDLGTITVPKDEEKQEIKQKAKVVKAENTDVKQTPKTEREESDQRTADVPLEGNISNTKTQIQTQTPEPVFEVKDVPKPQFSESSENSRKEENPEEYDTQKTTETSENADMSDDDVFGFLEAMNALSH